MGLGRHASPPSHTTPIARGGVRRRLEPQPSWFPLPCASHAREAATLPHPFNLKETVSQACRQERSHQSTRHKLSNSLSHQGRATTDHRGGLLVLLMQVKAPGDVESPGSQRQRGNMSWISAKPLCESFVRQAWGERAPTRPKLHLVFPAQIAKPLGRRCRKLRAPKEPWKERPHHPVQAHAAREIPSHMTSASAMVWMVKTTWMCAKDPYEQGTHMTTAIDDDVASLWAAALSVGFDFSKHRFLLDPSQTQ